MNVDCVVNANVLRMLSSYGLLNTNGVKESYLYISKAIKSEKHCFTCGNYYPTECTLRYTVSEAILAGADSLKATIPFIKSFLIKNQQEDGSWKSELPDNNIQSSAYALNTLLNIADNDSSIMKAIIKGVSYIRSKEIIDGQKVYWKGGIYFSGGTEARITQVWKSDAVTTVLCIQILVEYQELIKNSLPEYYNH